MRPLERDCAESLFLFYRLQDGDLTTITTKEKIREALESERLELFFGQVGGSIDPVAAQTDQLNPNVAVPVSRQVGRWSVVY